MKFKINNRFLYLCGMIAPALFIFVAILGGALRPGYSHVSDTVSELFSPGSPNKLLLDILHTIFALLLVLFGIGILRFVRDSRPSSLIGITGASLYIIMGILSIATATIFPQDAWGTTPTFSGQMHIYLSGALSLITLLSIFLMGIWFNQTGFYPGFGTYSFITIGAVIISAGFFVANQGSAIMGLTERVTALVGFQWTFTLALWMFTRDRDTSQQSI